MKNMVRFIGIIAFVTLTGLSMVRCDFSEDDANNGGNGGSGSNDDPFTVKDAAGWERVCKAIREGGNNKEYTITVNSDFSVPGSQNCTFGYSVQNITVTLQGNGTISLSSAGSLLDIYYNQTVIVKDLTLRGFAANNAAVVDSSPTSNFRMEGTASVTGNNGGYGVRINGNFMMQDSASVTNNISHGGVYFYGNTFTMKDNATISGNTSISSHGGGIDIDGGTFIMQGNASIKNNTTTYTGFQAGGGGVYVDSGTFTMQDYASVSGNIAPSGGGVSVSSYGGTFTIQNNATVSSNTANAGDGGGIMVGSHPNNSFNMYGGTISGNIASVDGGGVCVGRSAVFTKIGGTIYGSDASASQRNTASGKGHVAAHDNVKRDTTAGPGDNMSIDTGSSTYIGWDE